MLARNWRIGICSLWIVTAMSTLTTGDLIILENPEEERYAGFVLKEKNRLCRTTVYNTQLTGITISILIPGHQKLNASYVEPEEITFSEIHANLGYVHLRRSLHEDQRFAEMQSLICKNERSILVGFMSSRSSLRSSSFTFQSKIRIWGEGFLIL